MPEPIDIPPAGDALLANSPVYIKSSGVNQSQLNYLRKFLIGSGSLVTRQESPPEQLSPFSLLSMLIHMTSPMQQSNGMNALTIKPSSPA
jgi:hypothetical protein